MLARPLLRAHLHHALVSPRRFYHPPALSHKDTERFFDVNILARGTGHDGHEGVPMVGRGHNHRLNIFVVEKLAKIGIAFRVSAARCHTLFQAWLVDIGHGRQIRVRLIFEIADVLAAD